MSNPILLTVNGFNAEGTMGVSAEMLGALVTEITQLPLAQLDLPASNFYGAFQFYSDPANLVDGLNANGTGDLEYKFVMDGTSSGHHGDLSGVIVPANGSFTLSNVNVEGNAEFTSQTESEDGAGVPYPTPVGGVNNVEHDFVRHLAKELFKTTLGADLFANEADLRANLVSLSTVAMSDKLTQLDASGQFLGTEVADDNVSKHILDQIIALNPERMTDLSGNAVGGSSPMNGQSSWFNVPVLAGDVLSFKFNIKPAPGQHGVNSSAPVSDREYEILIRLV